MDAGNAIASAGTKVALTTTANQGYRFKEWQVTSGGVTISDNAFTMPENDVAITAVFAKMTSLAVPSSLEWDNTAPGKATWGAVENAFSYSVQLYKDGEPQGAAVSVTGTSCDFTITEAGSYTFTVKAVAEEGSNFVSSAESEKSAALHTVSFDTAGGTGTIPMQLVQNGGNATEPTTDPAKEGCTFAGWYSDSGLTTEWKFDTDIVAAATTLYAKWLSTNAGVASVVVGDTAGEVGGTQITVTLPYGSTLPDGTEDITITPATGAVYSNLTISVGADSVTYAFTVTAEDKTTTANYTVTVTIAPDPATGNRADIDAAKTVVESHSWTVPQAEAKTEEAAKAWIEGQLAGMKLNGASYTVTMTSFTAAAEGTAEDRDGTNGSFAFTVKLSKGENTGSVATSTYAEATVNITGGEITAPAYNFWTVNLTAGSGGTVSGGGTFEGGSTVTVTATPDSGYRFVRWTEDGKEVSTDASYSFTLTTDRSLTAAFSCISSGGGGGGGDTSYNEYTISASAGAGGSISPSGHVSVREGRDKTFTIIPAEGYIVADVLVDGVSVKHQLVDRQYTFKDVRAPHTIEASFAWVGAGTSPFIDVKPGDWFYAAVMDVYQRGIMSGTGPNTFSPNAEATRAQLAAILWRMAGSPEPAQIRHFTDVPAGAYYEKAVAWCTEQGLVGGYGNNLFGPDDAITREQLAVFLFNFANYKKFDTSARADLSGYKDADKISAWALEAVRWANAEGILNGNSDNTLTPQGHATRAQVASMISRFLARYDKDFILPPAGGGDKVNPNTGGGPGSPTRMDNVPQTGDNTPLWPFVALPVSAAGLVACTAARYRQKKTNHGEPPLPHQT